MCPMVSTCVKKRSESCCREAVLKPACQTVCVRNRVGWEQSDSRAWRCPLLVRTLNLAEVCTSKRCVCTRACSTGGHLPYDWNPQPSTLNSQPRNPPRLPRCAWDEPIDTTGAACPSSAWRHYQVRLADRQTAAWPASAHKQGPLEALAPPSRFHMPGGHACFRWAHLQPWLFRVGSICLLSGSSLE